MWIYKTHEELQEAGYTWRSYGFCEKCRSRILWYTNVDRHFVPIDPVTYQLHFIACEERTKKNTPDPSKVIDFGKKRQRTIGFR
jgi:hypothetical protein